MYTINSNIMKKASCGRRSSVAGRNTVGVQNSFESSEIRSSRGVEKKGFLLKPGFSVKKKKRSVSTENLSAQNPKLWTTAKEPRNRSRPTMVRSSSSINLSGINLVASTPCVTPGPNPNVFGMNSSFKIRRSNSESRCSSYGAIKNRKEVRPLTDKNFQLAAIHKIQNYFLTEPNACHILSNGSMKPMTTTMFIDMCEYLLQKLDRNQVLNKSKYVEELPKIVKKYYYKGKVDKSWLVTVNASHSFPQVVGLLLWLVELCETQNRINVMDLLYPLNLNSNEFEDEEYEQIVEFKMYMPFLLDSYQVECKETGKPADKEFLQKQEYLLLENYKNALGIDVEVLNQLETEVANLNEELKSNFNSVQEDKLEEAKAMQIALKKDVMSLKKYIEDVKICVKEVEEYVSKKKFKHALLEKEIKDMQNELNVVNDSINGQQITCEDKKVIEEQIIYLKQDIKYEENCFNEYSNIVYSEDLNLANIRMKLDKWFVQYNKICAENIIVLPELESLVADKNVLAAHVRESLKEVDKHLSCLKSKITEKLKAVEQKATSLQIELDSATLEYNYIKRNCDKLESDRDTDKNHLIKITDDQLKVKKEYEKKIFELEAEIKHINLESLIEAKTEEKNSLIKMLSKMEEEKDYIFTTVTNSLTKHAKLLEDTKKHVENLFRQQAEEMNELKNRMK